MDKFLEKYNLPKLNEEEAENLNKPIIAGEIETVIKKLLMHQIPGLNGLTFLQNIQEEPTPIFTDYSKKSKKMEDSQTRFMKPT